MAHTSPPRHTYLLGAHRITELEVITLTRVRCKNPDVLLVFSRIEDGRLANQAIGSDYVRVSTRSPGAFRWYRRTLAGSSTLVPRVYDELTRNSTTDRFGKTL